MIEIDNEKLAPRYAQKRIPGQFFKSGCSIAPTHPPKLKEGKRGKGKHRPHDGPVQPLAAVPMPVFDRLWARVARIVRNYVPTPSRGVDPYLEDAAE